MKALLYASALLVAGLAATGMRWAVDHYTGAPVAAPVFDDPRLGFHGAAHLARSAVQRYRDLPPYERRALNEALRDSLDDLDDWRNAVRDAGLLCLGERHDAAVRAFLASRVLPRVDYRVLMLETGSRDLERLVDAWRHGEPAMLLGAPAAGLLADAYSRRPRPLLAAIDEPASASAQPDAAAPPRREQRLVRAVEEHWRPGQRNAVVFGALHCRDLPGWMYHEIARARPDIAAAGMHGTVMLARYQEPGAQILFFLLEEMGFQRTVYAVSDVRRFPRQVQDWLPPTADALAGYRSALLFDERALDLDRRSAPDS